MRLYVDLDSTLTDFDKKMSELLGVKLVRGKEWGNSREIWKKVDDAGEPFWAEMEWLPGGKELWEKISKLDPTILSSPTRHETSKAGKKTWCAKELGENVPVILESKKEKYASPDAILIDDRPKNTQKWEEAGGKAILHKDVEDTLKKLDELMATEKEAFKVVKVRSVADPDKTIIIEKHRGGRGTQVHSNKKTEYDRKKNKDWHSHLASCYRVILAYLATDATVYPMMGEIADDFKKDVENLKTTVQSLKTKDPAVVERLFAQHRLDSVFEDFDYQINNVRRGDREEIARLDYKIGLVKDLLGRLPGLRQLMDRKAYDAFKLRKHPVVIDPYDSIVQQAMQKMGPKGNNIDVIKLELSCPSDKPAWVTNEDFFKGPKDKNRVVHLCLKMIKDQFNKAHGRPFNMANAEDAKRMRDLIITKLRDIILPHEAVHIEQETEGDGQFGPSPETEAQKAEDWTKLKQMGFDKKAGFFPEGYNPETGKFDGKRTTTYADKPLRREPQFSFKRLRTENINFVKKSLLALKNAKATKIWDAIEAGLQGVYTPEQELELKRMIESDANGLSLTVGGLVNSLLNNRSIEELRSLPMYKGLTSKFAQKVVRLYLASCVEAKESDKKLIIMRGISGAGKSTLAKKLETEYGAKAFSSDDFFIKGGRYVFEPAKIAEAHTWNHNRVREAMRRGDPAVIVDSTNTQAWEMKPYVEAAREHGYKVEFKEPDWSPELRDEGGRWNVDFIEQLQKGKDRTPGKFIPREVLERMRDRYQYGVTEEDILNSEKPF